MKTENKTRVYRWIRNNNNKVTKREVTCKQEVNCNGVDLSKKTYEVREGRQLWLCEFDPEKESFRLISPE